MPEIQKIEDAYIDNIIKSSEVYDPNLDVTQGIRLRELIKLMRDQIEQQGDLSGYQTKLSFDEEPTAESDSSVKSSGIKTYVDDEVNGLKGGVQEEGNTLQKLFNLISASFSEVTVQDLSGRDAYNVQSLPLHVFVKDDGDAKWALYKANTTGINAEFTKLMDENVFNRVMTASQIKASYESNPNTNAFTNEQAIKLINIQEQATRNRTDEDLLNRENHTGTQVSATISDFSSKVISNLLTGISDIYADGITSSDSILSAMGKLSNLIKTWKGYNPNSFAVETDSYKYAKLKSGIINLPNVSVTSNGYLFVQDAVIKYNDQAFPLNDRNVIRMPAMPPTGLKR